MHLRIQRTLFHTKNKLNVINEVWNEWSLPGIPTFFAPFDVMKNKNRDLELNVDWEWKDFWKGFGVKNKYESVIMQVTVLSKSLSLIPEMHLHKYLTCKGDRYFKIWFKPSKMYLRNIHQAAQISIYLLKITRRCISRIKFYFTLGWYAFDAS